MIKKLFDYFRQHEKLSFSFLLIIIAVIGYCSSISGSSPGIPRFNWLPIAYHFFIFFAFTFFLLLGTSDEKIEKKYLIMIIILSLLVGVLDEVHQIIVPLRDAGIKDVIIDFSGSVTGMIIFLIFNRELD